MKAATKTLTYEGLPIPANLPEFPGDDYPQIFVADILHVCSRAELGKSPVACEITGRVYLDDADGDVSNQVDFEYVDVYTDGYQIFDLDEPVEEQLYRSIYLASGGDPSFRLLSEWHHLQTKRVDQILIEPDDSAASVEFDYCATKGLWSPVGLWRRAKGGF